MTSTILSSKGQVIIPKAVRDARRWASGTRLEVRDTPEGVLLAPLPAGAKTPLAAGLAAIRARVAYRGKALSIAEMDAAVAREAARRKPGR
ncbi:MAG: AbrB/MazE/SpoVT family DNA-binding domain-containing protein [Burkholderiales bacterium]|nr:AbrB/MazE/SpoVT family DNA-binding domain-containing protein [Burkholderiales bacterium]